MLCYILPVFKCVKRNMAVSWIYVFVFMNYIFCYSMQIKDLLVDTLLPLQGMALLLFVYSECLNSLNKITGERYVRCTQSHFCFMIHSNFQLWARSYFLFSYL